MMSLEVLNTPISHEISFVLKQSFIIEECKKKHQAVLTALDSCFHFGPIGFMEITFNDIPLDIRQPLYALLKDLYENIDGENISDFEFSLLCDLLNIYEPAYITDTHLRLYHNTFPILVLERNIKHLSRKMLLNTQILNEEFVKKYIINGDENNEGVEDDYLIDINYIMRKQPHLSYDKLSELS